MLLISVSVESGSEFEFEGESALERFGCSIVVGLGVEYQVSSGGQWSAGSGGGSG